MIIVKALPWHSNAERDGTWWIGYENAEAEATHIDEGEAQHIIAHDPNNRYKGATHAEAVSALVAHIADAQEALEALKRHEPHGEFSE
jgi:hypothetical protein